MAKKMSARQHLKELQFRLMVVAAFFITGATLAYSYQDRIIPFLLAPIGNEKLIYLNPAGGFSFIFLVSIYAGIALAFPIFIQQLYGFLRPVLPKAAQRKSAVIIVTSLILLVAGVAFGYFVAVPNALNFLYGFADKYVNASLTADSYLNFVIAYTIGIGIVFQIPLLLMLVHAVHPLKPGGLMRSERWVILIAFIVAAFITPTPDPINQTLIAGPVIIVYQIGVVAILWSIFKKRRAEKRKMKQLVNEAKQNPKQAPKKVAPSSPSPLPAPQPQRVAPVAIQAPTVRIAPVKIQSSVIQDVVKKQQPGTTLQAQPQPLRPQRAGTPRSMDGFRSVPRMATPIKPQAPVVREERKPEPRPQPTPPQRRVLDPFQSQLSSDGIIRQRVVSF